jgi:hypothetical protein
VARLKIGRELFPSSDDEEVRVRLKILELFLNKWPSTVMYDVPSEQDADKVWTYRQILQYLSWVSKAVEVMTNRLYRRKMSGPNSIWGRNGSATINWVNKMRADEEDRDLVERKEPEPAPEVQSPVKTTEVPLNEIVWNGPRYSPQNGDDN